MTVYGFSGHAPWGGWVVPRKTIFQTPPFQRFQSEFLENHCCWEPEFTWPSILQSAMKPPLDHPWSQRFKSPFICVLRIAVPCETAQTLTLPSKPGVTERFSTHRQKLQVAFPFIQVALDRTAPVM